MRPLSLTSSRSFDPGGCRRMPDVSDGVWHRKHHFVSGNMWNMVYAWSQQKEEVYSYVYVLYYKKAHIPYCTNAIVYSIIVCIVHNTFCACSHHNVLTINAWCAFTTVAQWKAYTSKTFPSSCWSRASSSSHNQKCARTVAINFRFHHSTNDINAEIQQLCRHARATAQTKKNAMPSQWQRRLNVPRESSLNSCHSKNCYISSSYSGFVRISLSA